MPGTKRTVRAGIVGSGFAAELHIGAIERVHGTNVEVAGVWSPTRSNAERFAAAHGLAALDSLDALIDAADAVHVCAPPAAHESVAIAALRAGKHAIVEKPLTGAFDKSNIAAMHDAALASVARMREAETASAGRIFYAENWVYAPAIQKEREIVEKTGAQLLWMHGEEAHSGSHSPAYGAWRLAGGGSLIGKACHPLTAALYLKRVEGRARGAAPIRPAAVSARTHEITRLPAYRDAGRLRVDYEDVEDFGVLHIAFSDGTIADIFASEIVMGGIHNWLEICANNHRTICNINPNTAMQTYNPAEEAFRGIYVVEKIGTKQGWAPTAPDEDHFTGFPQEIEAFYRAVSDGEPAESDSALAADCIAAIYAGYVSAARKGAETAITLL